MKKTKAVSKVVTKTKVAVLTLGVAAAAASLGFGGYGVYQEYLADDFVAQYSLDREYANKSTRIGYGALEPHNANFVDSCKVGACAVFSGDNSYLSVRPSAFAPDFNAKQAITLSAWVYRKSMSKRTHVRILSKNFAFFMGFTDGGNKVSIDTGDGKKWDGLFTASKAFPLNEWVLVTYSFGQNFSKLFYNNTIVATNARARSLGSADNEFTVSGPTFKYNDSFDGMIDEVRIFARELSVDQVRDMYQSDSQGAQDTVPDRITVLYEQKKFFSERQDMPTPYSQSPFAIEQGNGKVLITAPHAVNHIRNGSVKSVDYCTGPIAKVVSAVTGAPIIYQQYKDRDPNYYDDTPFKKALAEYLDAHPEITTVFDIHGAAEAKGFDIDLGDMRGASLITNKKLSQEIESILQARGIKNISHNYFSALSATNTRIASRKGRDAVQFEINKTYRCSSEENTNMLLDALIEVVDRYK